MSQLYMLVRRKNVAVQALSVAEVRSKFSDILNRTAYGGQRFIVVVSSKGEP